MQSEYKFVKRAGMYVKTTFSDITSGSKIKHTQKQEWISQEQYDALPKTIKEETDNVE